MKLARNKMDRYWRHTDQSHVYRIAMPWYRTPSCQISLFTCSIKVLHPGLKLEYFQTQNWDAEWIKEAVTLTRAEYSVNYEGIVVATTDSMTAAGTNEPTAFFGFGDYSLGSDSTPTQPINELDDYLQQPLEKVDDALKWWSAHQQKYPNLSCMALDYLSAPGLFLNNLFHVFDANLIP